MYAERCFLVLVFTLAATSLPAGGEQSFEDPNEWIEMRIGPTDQLLCLLQSGHNWFFVARSEDRVKTGALIDVTNTTGNALSYIVSWEFRNGDGQHIGEPRPRDVQVSRHFERSGRIFAEEVVYRHVRWSSSFETDVGLRYLQAGAEVDKAQISANPPPVVANCEVQVPVKRQ